MPKIIAFGVRTRHFVAFLDGDFILSENFERNCVWSEFFWLHFLTDWCLAVKW